MDGIKLKGGRHTSKFHQPENGLCVCVEMNSSAAAKFDVSGPDIRSSRMGAAGVDVAGESFHGADYSARDQVELVRFIC